jgi:hypothetical protein
MAGGIWPGSIQNADVLRLVIIGSWRAPGPKSPPLDGPGDGTEDARLMVFLSFVQPVATDRVVEKNETILDSNLELSIRLYASSQQ